MPEEVRLAIVGSTAFSEDVEASAWAVEKINEAIDRLRPHQIISGGAIGIDELAVLAADAHGIGIQEFLPESPRWEPRGYKDRNKKIAAACTHLLCIRHHASTTYGSGWTADHAESLGAVVERLMYERKGEANAPEEKMA